MLKPFFGKKIKTQKLPWKPNKLSEDVCLQKTSSVVQQIKKSQTNRTTLIYTKCLCSVLWWWNINMEAEENWSMVLLICIWLESDYTLGRKHPEYGVSWSCSVTPGKFRKYQPQLGHYRLMQRCLQFSTCQRILPSEDTWAVPMKS